MQHSAKRKRYALLCVGALTFILTAGGLEAGLVRAQENKRDAKPRLLFVSDREMEHEYAIYAMNPDGSGQTRISKGPGMAFDPAWSPDHTRIVFVSVTKKETPQSDLMIMKADGSDPTLLVAGAEKTLLISPSWSSDGKQISYSAVFVGNGKLESAIHVVDANGKNQRKLEDGLISIWSPDGKRLLFSGLPDDKGIPALKSMDADGNNVKTLTPKGLGASFSPDGKRIAFTGESDKRPAVFVMDADGSHLTQLTKDAETMALGPVWTPDGTHLLFTRLPKENGSKPKLQICQMDADGGNVKAITKEDSFLGVGTSIIFVARAVRH